MREKPLVIFTLLSQTAVGFLLSILAIEIYSIYSVHGEPELGEVVTRSLLLVCFLISSLSLLASLFHLGNPLIAWTAIRNLRTSWLSREVLFSVLFTTSLLILLLMNNPVITLRGGIVAALLGVITIYSMSKVYRLRTSTEWNNWHTSVSFFVTTAVLGCLSTVVAFALLDIILMNLQSMNTTSLNIPIRTLLEFIFVILTLKTAYLVWNYVLIKKSESIESKGDDFQSSKQLFGARLLVFCFTLVFLSSIIFFEIDSRLWIDGSIFLVFAFTLFSETIERVKFYDAADNRLM